MAREFAKSFYKSKAWRKCRESFIAERVSIDGGMCQECGEELGYIVHHKEWINESNIDNPYITLNHENLEYVCHVCHNRIEQGDREEERYTFDSQGQLIPIDKERGNKYEDIH